MMTFFEEREGKNVKEIPIGIDNIKEEIFLIHLS